MQETNLVDFLERQKRPAKDTGPTNKQDLTAELMFEKPQDPRKFVLDRMQSIKAGKYEPIVPRAD
ncbi:hypothetical protein PROFUN_03022 [Planoprotostelium fungivorum]|uniref:Uncharacterized protein n=1 Tax=Planoprotostelium fungivorum TaxID=1890364 RepID=A0A2P6NXC6_9EUKA|nr:hypothetical protein PROFUN_03022 [Planoprotostelium fungivorum]